MLKCPFLLLAPLLCLVLTGPSLAASKADEDERELLDVTDLLSPQQFVAIKKFILEHGNRQTYCNMYSHNPHYNLGSTDLYLSPAVGQMNINCDPTRSDFNELVIHNFESPGAAYLYLYYAQNRDPIAGVDTTLRPGTRENRVYLPSVRLADREALLSRLRAYLMELDREMKRVNQE